METHAQDLVYRLLQLMPSPHLRASLQCLLALFLLAQRPRASDAATKSEAALSRFLNCYGWPTRKALQAIRQHSHRLIASYSDCCLNKPHDLPACKVTARCFPVAY
jgi:hypothetical protein